MSMHQEDYEKAAQNAEGWASVHRKPLLIAVAILIAFALGAFACRSKAASIDIPACDSLTIIGQTPAVVTLGCGHNPTPGGPADYSACASAGYTAHPLTMAWPLNGNTHLPTTGNFGNADAIVVSFTTPATVGKSGVFQPAGFAPTQNTTRLYTISTKPCQFAVSAAQGGIVGQSPAIHITVGTCPYGPACPSYGQFLQPATTYYVTMVNRNGFAGTSQYNPSCAGNCPMRVDFDKAN